MRLQSEKNTRVIKIKTPYQFNLIPNLSLKNKEYRFPYLYLENSWSCLVPVHEREIPVRITILKENKELFLKLKTYDNMSTKETKDMLLTIKRSFNTDLNLQPFYRFARDDKKLYETISNLRGLKPFFAINPYHSLIRTVLRQLVSATAASQFMTKLVTVLGNSITCDGFSFHGMPSPEKLAKSSKQELISCKVGYKWRLLKTLANDIVNGDLDFEELEMKSDDYIIERLQEYSGIGDWTCRTFLYDGFARLDSYPKYDMTLVKTISDLYHTNKKITNTVVDKFFKKYSKYHGIVIPYLFGHQWLKHALSENRQVV